ncbi:MAG: transporter [Clostridiales bacterium]|nr:transporter [Clostridiales bacterium]
MNITEISVRRPAAVIMVVVLAIGLGIIGYSSLGANLLPDVDMPIISVMTTYPGAGVEEIEKDIIKPIEDEISSVSGLDTMRSGVGVGYGYTTLMFKMDVNADTAFADVQQALGNVSSDLPKDASKPVIRKFNKNNQPVLRLSISGEIPYEELYSQADQIKQVIEKLKGVGGVTLEGALEKQVSVKIDKAALEYYGISINTVVNKLLAENMGIPAGQIKQETSEQTLRVMGEFEDIKDIKGLHIPLTGGGTVRLDEIGEIAIEYPEPEELIRMNGEKSIGIFIQKQSDANIIQTTNIIKKQLKKIEETLPKGISIKIADDQSSFINSTLKEIKNNLIEGIITTSIVMFLFMRRWRSSLIVLVAIPTALVATFFMMYVFKFTLNIMSLMGLSSCIGILVDDSIVVLENIQRHLRYGKDSVTAAIEGRKEIGLAAIAITLCDVVVFGPVAFMSGMIGQFFKEFGLTVVFATLFSLAVSFTVTPMLSAKLLRKKDDIEAVEEGSVHKKSSRFSQMFEKITGLYQKTLLWSLEHRWKVVGIVTAGVILSAALIPLKLINTEFIPKADQSNFTIRISLKPGTNLVKTDEKVKLTEAYIREMKEIKTYMTTVGDDGDTASAQILVNLVDKNERKKSESQIVEEVRSWGKKVEGIDFSVSESSIVGDTSVDGSKPIAINILGADKKVLKKLSGEVESMIQSIQGVTDIGNTARAGQNEINVKIDRIATAHYGIMASDIAATLRTSVNGTNAGVFRNNGNDYDIIIKFADKQIKTSNDLGSVKITGMAGQQVALEQVAKIETTDSPQEILRQDKRNLVSVSANIQGRTLGEVNKEIADKISSLQIPKGYDIKYGGDQENMMEAFDSLIKALIASIVLVYMILVVLYESYLTPVIRMLALPCALIGALGALAITGSTLNVISMIGLIMLDGLASKNGTLLIDYTNTLMKKGIPMKEALLEAGTTRLRPIIMTSVTMIVGMIPAAIALGEGSEIKSSMAIAIIGGMVTSTLLSPLLIPAVYTIIDDIRKSISNKKKIKSMDSIKLDGGMV